MSASALLYRSLLKAAKEHDRRPLLKALLTGNRSQQYDRGTNTWLDIEPMTEEASKCYDSFAEEFFSHGLFYKPEVSLQALVQKSFLKEAGQNFESGQRLDAAFMALRQLDGNTAFSESVFLESNASEKQLLAPADHYKDLALVDGLEPGKYLVAHPLLFQPVLWRSIILLCQYTESGGALGVVTNRPTGKTLGDVLEDDVLEDHPELAPFLENHLWKGGDVGTGNSLLFVHNCSGVDGATTLRDGLYFGGQVKSMAKAIADGKVKAEDFKIFVGYAGWGAEQLLGEVNQNTWFVVEQGTASPQGTPQASRPLRMALVPSNVVESTNSYSAFDMPTLNAMWQRACEELGGEFSGFSEMKSLVDMNAEDVAELRQRAWGM
jgi:putative transcriptional regulator